MAEDAVFSQKLLEKTNKEINVRSCSDAIARAVKEAMGAPLRGSASWFRERCEDCGRPIRREANCGVCGYCGESKCG